MKMLEKKKKILAHLTVYLCAAAVSVFSVIQAGKGVLPEIAGFAVYALAAILLTGACVLLYQDIRRGIMVGILESVKQNPLGQRFLEDYSFRTVLTTLPVFSINVIYTVYNGVIGIMNRSVWFITMAVYYSLLGIMRFQAVSAGRKTARLSDPEMIRKKELRMIKTDGILLLLLNLSLSGVVLLTIAMDTARRYPDVIVISIAAYTFYKITMAVINMVKSRKTRSPILITIRNIGVADALVSMLTLQSTMLVSFGGENGLEAGRMNGITGLAVCILISMLGVSMIRYACKKRS